MSDHSHKLSLWSAFLININVMFGTGVFINTVNLAKLAGSLGFLSYLFVALLILPLIFSIAALLRRHPSGGFYTYGAKDISPFAGFLSAWAYFTAKLASATLLIHVFSSLLRTIIPSLQIVNPLIFDMIIIGLFTWLNMLNMKTGTNIMYTFFILKVTPILFAVLSGIYLYKFWSIPPHTLLWPGIPSTIPLVLYAFTGFEACCSISRSIDNAEKNAPKAVLYSYLFVVFITIAYQFIFFATVGTTLMAQENFLGAFPTLLHTLFPFSQRLADHMVAIMHIALATSALGGSYGILFSNHWNLYALAQHNHTFFKNALTTLNRHYIPTMCVISEIALCILYLLLTGGNQIPLQQISVLGCTIAYTLSILGMLLVAQKGILIYINHWIVRLALGSCLLLISACIRNFIINGMHSLILFGALLMIGIGMFWWTSSRNNSNQPA